MDRVRVICFVHQDGVRVVIDRNRHRSSTCQFNSRGGSAAPGKVVHDDFIKNVCLSCHTSPSTSFIACFTWVNPFWTLRLTLEDSTPSTPEISSRVSPLP